MSDSSHNPRPRDRKADEGSLSQIEELLHHARSASAFEEQLSAPESPRFVRSWVGHGVSPSGVESRGGARTVGPLRLVLTSAAACAAIGLAGFYFLRGTATNESTGADQETVAAAQETLEMLVGATAEPVEKTTTSHGDLVVAIYRGEDSRGDGCGECWCVRRWSPHWGADRNVNELEETELVDDSIVRSCVGNPSRVIVIGLSGPEDALPKTDDQALQLSLCLIGQSPSAGITCVPRGLDYCMAGWSR
jgi:hypothetical protein